MRTESSVMRMNILWICVGALMLFGSFATIASPGSSPDDQNFGLILLIAGGLAVAFGFGVIDASLLENLTD